MSWESFVDSDIMNSDYGAETCSSGYITPQLGSEQEYNINSILKNREQKVEIKTNHRRAQSLNSLLPQEIVSIFDGDQKPTIDIYDQLIEQRKIKEAKLTLKELISRTNNPKEKYKIFRAAADSNKRKFYNEEAIKLYEMAERIDPSAPQCYLDHAKLLDEIGNSEGAEMILKIALVQTQYSDQITVKLLKQFERRQRFNSARLTLGEIYKNRHVKGAIPSIAEGILFEAKYGDVENAIKVFQSIDQKMINKSGFFVELSECLRRRGYFTYSTEFAELGKQKNLTMPNNWNQLLQLQKTKDAIFNTLLLAKDNLSQSTLSKLIQSAALLLAINHNDLVSSRYYMAESLFSSDQKWRSFYNAGLIEIFYGDNKFASLLFEHAYNMAPQKFKSTALLAFAKASEINQNIAEAEKLYNLLYEKYNSDWRIYLEYSMFLVRRNEIEKALNTAKEGLNIYPNTGRLWALRIQLEEGAQQISILKEAIKTSPKSGEIWIEAVRIVLNPLSPYFNLKNARFFLNIAFLFTPQYIDIFIEMTRLEILENGIGANLDKVRQLFVSGDGNYGTVFYLFRKLGTEFSTTEFNNILQGIIEDVMKNRRLYSRAIARSSFVIESITKAEEKLKKDQQENDRFKFTFGLSSFFEKMRKKEYSKEKVSIIMGSSGAFL